MSIFRFQGGLLYTVGFCFGFGKSRQRKKGGIGSMCKFLIAMKRVRRGGGIWMGRSATRDRANLLLGVRR
jgi:hypothetical protein